MVAHASSQTMRMHYSWNPIFFFPRTSEHTCARTELQSCKDVSFNQSADRNSIHFQLYWKSFSKHCFSNFTSKNVNISWFQLLRCRIFLFIYSMLLSFTITDCQTVGWTKELKTSQVVMSTVHILQSNYDNNEL